MENNNGKVHHVAFVTAKSYAHDGYHLVSFDIDEKNNESRYNLVHDNGNYLTIYTNSEKEMVIVKKNGKINNVITY